MTKPYSSSSSWFDFWPYDTRTWSFRAYARSPYSTTSFSEERGIDPSMKKVCAYGEWLIKSAYGTSASVSISLRLIPREKSIDIAHSKASHVCTSEGRTCGYADDSCCTVSYSARSLAWNERVDSTTGDPWSSASSSSPHVKLCPTSSVLGSRSMYGAHIEASPLARSCTRRRARAMYSPSGSISSAPSSFTAFSFVMTSRMGICSTASPCVVCFLAISPRPEGSKSSVVSLSTLSGCAARPHELSGETHTPLAASHSMRAASRCFTLAAPFASSRSISRGAAARRAAAAETCAGAAA
mmetsp:Transcript_48216/g.119416  ORF Transcript_48216/g.119416 Transcript_48216/m.119416 type:complete len:298 (+) Transcript_48216:721-1614(+)